MGCTGGSASDAPIGLNLASRLVVDARMDKGKLRHGGRAQHEWVEVRQTHVPIH
jgi:hypothetical protein